MSNYYGADITQSAEYQQELAAQRTFMARVYGWMTIGLLLTTAAAFIVASSAQLRSMFLNTPTVIGVVIVQFLIALAFSFLLNKIPAAVATALFVIYSALTGMTIGAIVLLVFKGATVASAFLTTAGMFGAMTVWGYTTKKDLTGVGSFMMMGLFGLIIAGIVSMFLGGPNPMMHFVMCIVGVIVFTGLTAYDTQKIKQSYAVDAAGSALYKKAAIFGAFALYLDFINLFLYLVQLFASRDGD